MSPPERTAFLSLLAIATGLIGFFAWLSRRDTP